jgi:uncharacterized protein YcbK (DUF882 family)
VRVLFLILLLTSTAHARGAPDKPPPRAVDRVKLERELRKKIGKPPARLVNVHRLHTHEWLAIEADPKAAQTIPQAVADDFFRCHFTNQRPVAYDLRLIGILISAALKFQADTVHVVSGFRAPKYNLSLRKKGREVARDSQHTLGHAVDFRIPGIATTRLRDWLRSLRLGGVGYYPESQFVHADVGKIRTWTGR